jgi:hypothetical protein
MPRTATSTPFDFPAWPAFPRQAGRLPTSKRARQEHLRLAGPLTVNVRRWNICVGKVERPDMTGGVVNGGASVGRQ